MGRRTSLCPTSHYRGHVQILLRLPHLQIEPRLRTGMNMMKFTINHPDEFHYLGYAFNQGQKLFLVSLLTELLSIWFISTINDVPNLIVKITALGAVAKVGDFFKKALPGDVPIKCEEVIKEHPMMITRYKNIRDSIEFKTTTQFTWKKNRFIYSFYRVLYTVCISWTVPYINVFLPYFTGGHECHSHHE